MANKIRHLLMFKEDLFMDNDLKVEKVACLYCEEVFIHEELKCDSWMVLGKECSIYQCPYCDETDGLLFIKEYN